MRQSVWLYLYLLLAVNPKTGTRLFLPAEMGTQMGLKEDTIRSWMGRLRKAGYVRVERQGEYLRVEITRWRAPASTEPKEPTSAKAPSRPRGITADQLARQLGEEPGDPFWERVIETWDEPTIQQVIADVKRVPDEQIRKSRAALFRYLITRRREADH
jgi:DNA-binding transcriptional ArsR family regulator